MSHFFAIVPIEILQDERLTATEVKMLVCLLSFRNKSTNLTCPSAKTIAERLNWSDHTRVSKITSSLVKKEWLKKTKKSFNGSVHYEFIVPKKFQLDDEKGSDQVGLNDQDGENDQVGSKHQLQVGLNDQLQVGLNDQPNRQTNKQINRKYIPAKFSKEHLKFASECLEEIKLINPSTNSKAEVWADDIRKLIEIDKKTFEEIKKAWSWARQDKFWKTNFKSISKLRERNKDGIFYIEQFLEKALSSGASQQLKTMTYESVGTL